MQYKMPSPPFVLGQTVYHGTRQWYITGLALLCGYDTMNWELELSRSEYGKSDDPGCPWMSKSDVDRIKVREDQVKTISQFNQEKLRRAKEEVAAAETALEKARDRESEASSSIPT